jgi:hypothetical protein
LCLFTHVAAGALAGAYAPNLYIAPVFGLGSHIALDMIPHRDFDNMAVEIVLAVVAVAVLAIGGAAGPAVLLGIVFGILPDLENLLWKLGKIADEQKIFPGHVGFLKHGAVTGVASIYLQAVLAAAVILLLVWKGV